MEKGCWNYLLLHQDLQIEHFQLELHLWPWLQAHLHLKEYGCQNQERSRNHLKIEFKSKNEFKRKLNKYLSYKKLKKWV